MKTIVIAGIFGITAVILGAFGAHALAARLTPELLNSYRTGVDYQFYHSFLLLGLGLWRERGDNPQLRWAVRFAIIGILCFSGSIYLLACRDLIGIGVLRPFLGPVTPIGGLFFIAAWLMVIIAAWRK